MHSSSVYSQLGVVDETQCDGSMIEEDGHGKYTRIFIKDQKIVGVISLEGVVASLPYKAAIENNISLAGIDINHTSVSDVMNEIKGHFNVEKAILCIRIKLTSQ